MNTPRDIASGAAPSAAGDARLTRAEYDVWRALAAGDTWAQVIHDTGTSKRTVAAHMKNVYRKFGVSTREEVYAALGWLDATRCPSCGRSSIPEYVEP